MSHIYFRKIFTDFFDGNKVENKLGRISKEKITINPGYRLGNHGEIECWNFETYTSKVIMAFGFYSNFTKNDLICKVGTIEQITSKGIGASIQFNANKSFILNQNKKYELIHSGSITVGHSISREVLANLFNKLTYNIARRFLISDKNSWPVLIGSTTDFPKLLDNLFLYGFAMEQVKRSIRKEELLPE